jgi:hypothetical protein
MPQQNANISNPEKPMTKTKAIMLAEEPGSLNRRHGNPGRTMSISSRTCE